MVASTWTVVSWLSISETKDETVTRGKSYKFALLNQSIIRSLWEIGHKFVLENPNQVRPVELEIRFKGIPQGQILDIEDLKPER